MAKRCTKCKDIKAIDDFHRDVTHKDGHRTICKKCYRQYLAQYRKRHPNQNKEWKKNNPHKIRNNNVKYYSTHKNKIRIKAKEWKQANTEKVFAHSKLNYALSVGKVIKPRQCNRCNKKGFVMGHHSDYTKPLKVEWLCVSCHKKEHRKAG